MIQIIETAQKLGNALSELKKLQLINTYQVRLQSDFSIVVTVFAPKPQIKEVKKQLELLASPSHVIVNIHNEIELEAPYFESYRFSEPGLRLGARFRLGSMIEPGKVKSNRDDFPPLVAFYSYKGGVGRTTTLVAYALHLASKGLQVAIIDSDLEAPGYLNFFDLSNQKELAEGKRNGLVEYLSDSAFAKNGRIDGKKVQDYVVSPDMRNGYADFYNNIFLMPAGNLNERLNETEDDGQGPSFSHRRAYLEGLSRVDFGNQRCLTQGFENLLQDLKSQLKADVVLVDSRTGFNDILGSVVMGMARHVVGFFGFSSQNTPGLRQLVESYHERGLNFGLTIVPAILPRPTLQNAEWMSRGYKSLNDFLTQADKNQSGVEDKKDLPAIFPLYRQGALEMLGTDNKEAETQFASMAIKGENEDYVALFAHLDEAVGIGQILSRKSAGPVEDAPEPIPAQTAQETQPSGPTETPAGGSEPAGKEAAIPQESNDNPVVTDQKASKSIPGILRDTRADFKSSPYDTEPEAVDDEIETRTDYATWSARKLSKGVLRVLQRNLQRVKNFAEDCDFDVNQFFYRDCMSQIFDPDKFLIIGHKGTGKTYLYRALSEKDDSKGEIRRFIRMRAGKNPDDSSTYINVVPLGISGSSALECLTIPKLQSETYDFRAMWQILLWNSLMQDPMFEPIYAQSPLYGQSFPASSGNKALLAAEKIMAGGLDTLVAIEDDLGRANDFLAKKGIELSVLYDRLDSVINPKYWGNAVSPLVAYWRENTGTFSNIHPKIFVRTDLFKRIEGANTVRMKERNVMLLDWRLEEVFGYVLKLVYSDPEGRACLWQIMRKLRKDTAELTIKNMENALDADHGMGQLPRADRPSLAPFVRILFGTLVKPEGTQGLGDPWSYFSRELANADGSVSLRPFINTLSDDVLSRGMQDNSPHVQCVLRSDYYAATDVREKAANDYFDDLTSDRDYSSDLRFVRDFLRSDSGKDYRYKTLTEESYNNLMRGTMDSYAQDMKSVRNVSELSDLLQASGVAREEVRRGGKLYRFALMFHYVWGLQSTSYDTEISFRPAQPVEIAKPKEGDICLGTVTDRGTIEHRGLYYRIESNEESFPAGAKVRFRVCSKPHYGDESKRFYYADNITEAEEV